MGPRGAGVSANHMARSEAKEDLAVFDDKQNQAMELCLGLRQHFGTETFQGTLVLYLPQLLRLMHVCHI